MLKLLFLALDGVDTRLVDVWKAELPTLSALLGGNTCTIQEPEGLPGAFWPSLYTGMGPARHGTYEEHAAPQAPPFWNAWELAGTSCAAVDLPQMPIVEPGGCQVAAWGVDDVDRQSFRTVPATLAHHIHAQIGLPRPLATDLPVRDPESVAVIRDEILERIELKEILFDVVRKDSKCDVLLFAFGDARTAGLMLWHAHDRRHPLHASGRGADDPLLAVYRRLDTAVERLLDAPAAARIVLFRGHWAPAADCGRFLPAVAQALAGSSTVCPHRSLAWRAQRWLGKRAPEMYRRCRAVSNTAAFGAIRVHVRGRDRGGRIQPGRECESMLDDLTEGLLELQCTNVDRCPVTRVIRTNAVHEGPKANLLPDLLIEWAPEATVHGIHSHRIGELAWPSYDPQTGVLMPGATLCATGMDLPGHLAIEDVAAWLEGVVSRYFFGMGGGV